MNHALGQRLLLCKSVLGVTIELIVVVVVVWEELILLAINVPKPTMRMIAIATRARAR